MKLLVSLILTVFTTTLWGAETSLGVWRDQAGTAFERTIEILRSGESLVQRNTFKGGKSVERQLKEKTPAPKEQRVFFVVGSQHGDGCAIRKDEDLDLFDATGFIRTAKKMKRP